MSVHPLKAVASSFVSACQSLLPSAAEPASYNCSIIRPIGRPRFMTSARTCHGDHYRP